MGQESPAPQAAPGTQAEPGSELGAPESWPVLPGHGPQVSEASSDLLLLQSPGTLHPWQLPVVCLSTLAWNPDILAPFKGMDPFSAICHSLPRGGQGLGWPHATTQGAGAFPEMQVLLSA